jgi:hypothetical protein
MAELLQQAPFSLAASDITRLAGWPDDEARRPTKANILAQLQRLAVEAKASPGEQIVILLAGHGSQQPASADDPGDSEPDGLDELFLPADVKGWNGQLGAVENALVDDDLRKSLTEMRNNGAFVWLIMDSCHSGTMSRGGGEVERYVAPADLGIPASAFAAGERSRGAAEDGTEIAPDAGELVAFYAARPSETTPEMGLPDYLKDGIHGLFSYTLAEVLRRSETRLTYRELAAAVAESYRGRHRNVPTPLVEGGALDREVLGVDRPERPTILVKEPVAEQGGHYLLAAGDLDGLTPGSILEAFPPAGARDAQQVIARLRIVEVDPLEAEAALVESIELPAAAGGAPRSEWREVPAARRTRLPAGARCRVVYRDFGALRMPIGVQTEALGGPRAGTVTFQPTGKGPAAIEAALAALAKQETSLVIRVDDERAAEWFVRLRGGDVVLVPRSGLAGPAAGDPAGAPQAFVVAKLTDRDLQADLADNLRRVARAHHLLGLQRSAEQSRGAEVADDVHVEVEMLRLADKNDRQGTVVAFDGKQGRMLRSGEWVAFRVHNSSKVAVDLTLLFVSSSFGIEALNNVTTIDPGDTLERIGVAHVTTKTLGLEQVVAIAVKSMSPPRSFASLAQPDLVLARGAVTRGEDSPLAQLLDTAMYGVGGTRGLDQAAVDAYDVETLSWTTVPAPAPPSP